MHSVFAYIHQSPHLLCFSSLKYDYPCHMSLRAVTDYEACSVFYEEHALRSTGIQQSF